MPNSLQTLDTSFPKIDDHQTTEENFLRVTNYLYMLLENLRYTLGNLGMENINATEMDSIAQLIREPVWARIEDQEGNINTLNVTAENLLSQIGDINGNVSTLQQTSQILTSHIQTAEGNISKLTQTANGLTSKVSELESGISTQIQQTLNGITLSATNGDGNTSTITLSGNGITTKSAVIQFKGFVTFGALSDPNSNTSINGGLIKTGAINASLITTGALSADRISGGTLEGVTFVTKDDDGVYNSVSMQSGVIKIGNATISSKIVGGFSIVDALSEIYIGTSNVTTIQGGGGVRLLPDETGGKYWEFTNEGIFWKDKEGNTLSYVNLTEA